MAREHAPSLCLHARAPLDAWVLAHSSRQAGDAMRARRDRRGREWADRNQDDDEVVCVCVAACVLCRAASLIEFPPAWQVGRVVATVKDGCSHVHAMAMVMVTTMTARSGLAY